MRTLSGWKRRLGITISLLCPITTTLSSSAAEKEGYSAWLKHRQTILEDPALVEYFDFENPGYPFKNKTLKPDAALRDGAMKHSPVKTRGRWPGKTASYFNRMSYIETSNLPFGFEDAMTIEAWYKPTTNKPWSYIYTDWGGQDHSFELGVPDGKILFSVSADGNAKRRATAIGKTVMALNQWHYIVATFDKGVLKIYLDGRLEGSVKGKDFATIHNPVNDSKDPLKNSIPRRISHANTRVPMHPAIGYMDELAVYKRALNKEEVTARYNSN